MSINEQIPAFEFDYQEDRWKSLRLKDEILISNQKNFLQLKKELISPTLHTTEHYILGLPRTGKTTFARHSLLSVSKENRYCSYYLPCQKNDMSYKDIIQGLPVVHNNSNPRIFVLDNFRNLENPQNWFPQNTRIYIIPNQPLALKTSVYDPNFSFIKPLSQLEIRDLIDTIIEKQNILLSPLVLKRIVEYSGGIPELALKLPNYFYENRKLPNCHNLEEIQKHFGLLPTIAARLENIKSYDEDKWRLILGVFSTGKTIDALFKVFQLELNSDAVQIKKLGIDDFTNSSFIKAAFLTFWGEKRQRKFFNEDIENYLNQDIGTKTKKAVWTNNFNLRYHDSLADYVISIMKDYSRRVEWDNLKVNGKKLPNLSYQLQNGDRVEIRLGRRISKAKSQEIIAYLSDKSLQRFVINPSRSKRYRKRRKKQRNLVHSADRLCRKGEWQQAEQLYRKAIKIGTDADWGRVRLANLLRLEGRCEEALEICEIILRSTPNPYASLCGGICHYWSGDINKALNSFKKCLEWRKGYCNAMYWNARCLLHFNQISQSASLSTNLRQIISRRNRGSKQKRKPLIQENFIRWLTLYYEGRIVPFNKMSERLYKQISEVIQSDSFPEEDNQTRKTRLLPLSCLYYYLTEREEFDKASDFAREVCNSLPGIKYDIYMWCKLIPWREKYSSLSEQDFFNKLFSMNMRR